MSPQALQTTTRKELASLAKEHSVTGWHGMRKGELVEALMDVFRASRLGANPADRGRTNGRGETPPTTNEVNTRVPPAGRRARGRNPGTRTPPVGGGPVPARRAVAVGHVTGFNNGQGPRPVNGHSTTAAADPTTGRGARRDISTVSTSDNVKEELVAVAHDPHWIHCRWVLKSSTVRRAEMALGAEWHRAVPVLRLFAVHTHETKSTSEEVVRDEHVTGDTDHWFLHVGEPPATFRVQLGFLAGNGKFFPLMKSRRLTTPRPGSKAAERIRLAKPTESNGSNTSNTRDGSGSGDPMFEKFLGLRASYAGAAYGVNGDGQPHSFALETELLIRGTAHPDSQVALAGDPIKVGSDGRFAVKLSLPDGRQSIDAVALSPDKTRTQTIILSVERELDVQAPKPTGKGS